MRFLFLTYISPGPLGAMATWLAANPQNKVIMASSRSRQENPIPNIQRVVLKSYPCRKPEKEPDYFDLWEEAAKAGKSARASLESVKQSGFEPDIILGATSNGAALGLRRIFPDAFLANFLEEENFFKPGQSQMRMDLQCLQILQANMSFAFTEARKKSYPPELQARIGIAPLAVNADFFSPEKARPFSCWKFAQILPELVTVSARNLTENDLFHCWNACLEILAARPDCQIVLLVNGSYVMRRLAHLQIPENLASRLYIECHLRQDIWRDLLCASALAVFPGNPAPFGILEAMACATPPLLAREWYFLKPGWDYLGMPGSRAAQIRMAVHDALENKNKLLEIGLLSRKTVTAGFAADVAMPRFFPQISRAYELWNA